MKKNGQIFPSYILPHLRVAGYAAFFIAGASLLQAAMAAWTLYDILSQTTSMMWVIIIGQVSIILFSLILILLLSAFAQKSFNIPQEGATTEDWEGLFRSFRNVLLGYIAYIVLSFFITIANYFIMAFVGW